ncbi:AraC family transcriptional regulator, partial [Leptospira borgpetersenii serovar Arborea]|nr:AraC family transcriptional regulator [Leptospira borgpetersenii serovar Arborea]
QLAANKLRTARRRIFVIVMNYCYVSQQTFSRIFCRQFDLTPSEYRQSA